MLIIDRIEILGMPNPNVERAETIIRLNIIEKPTAKLGKLNQNGRVVRVIKMVSISLAIKN